MKQILILLILLFLGSCKQGNSENIEYIKQFPTFQPKFSLAQWVYNKSLFSGEMSTLDFIQTASDMGFDGVDYVDQFFADKVDDIVFLSKMKQKADSLGIKNVMIMIDLTGKLCTSNELERKISIENTKKWVDAAVLLGCESLRVNAHGDGTPDEMKSYCMDGIKEVAKYAQGKGIILTIENHGGISSNGSWLANLIEDLKEYGVASFPDFGNWCEERENGELWGSPCIKTYDSMKGLKELLPYAKAISMKSHAFDENGNEKSIDYNAIFKEIIESGYKGYLSCEYEGEDYSPKEGTEKTRALALKSIQQVMQTKK